MRYLHKLLFLIVVVLGAVVVIHTATYFDQEARSEDSEQQFLERLFASIIQFKASGEASSKINLQDFSSHRIRKLCDQYRLMTREEYEEAIGESVPAFNPETRRSGTVLWVFFEDAPPLLVSIPLLSDAFIGPSLSRPRGAFCSSSAEILLLHTYIPSDSVGHMYDFKLDWRL